MADYVCHGCGQKKAGYQANECQKCGKVLCEKCRGGKVVCRESPKGTPGCVGTFKQRP